MPYVSCPMSPALCLLPYVSCPVSPALCLLPYVSSPMSPALCLLPYVSSPMSPVLCLLPYVSCPMSPALCLLPYVSCPMSPVLCLLPYVSCPMSPAICLQSYVSCPMSPALCLLPYVSSPMSPALCLLSCVSCPMSPAICLQSYVSCPVSPVLCLLSYVSCPVSPALCLLPCVSCPVSPVLCLLSCVSCPMSPALCLLSYVSCPMSPVLCLLPYVSSPMSPALCLLPYVSSPMSPVLCLLHYSHMFSSESGHVCDGQQHLCECECVCVRVRVRMSQCLQAAGVRLEGVVFNRVRLEGVVFNCARLEGVVFNCARLEGVVFNCSCEVRWLQLWQQRGEAGLHNQQLFCNNGISKTPLQLMNISQCDPPEISVTHGNLTVTEGDRITITCNGSGVPVPDVDWNVNSLHSINTHQAVQYPPNVHSINLTLFNVSRDDNFFLLTCIAENVVGMTNVSVQLSVQFPPSIVRFEEPERWHDTCMMFTVRGHPLPTLRWLYRDEELVQSEYVRMEAEVYQDYLEGCLVFKNPTHHNNGNYTIEARNFLGVATRTVDAHFMTAPFTAVPSNTAQKEVSFITVPYVTFTVHPSVHSPVSPSLTPTITVTHRPEEDTFGVSIAVGLAGFICILLLVMFVLINKYGRRAKFGMKVCVLSECECCSSSSASSLT
ncbi:hypothetical protein P4O66_003929 [Electrophorus voltai]|uniref:Ig-like domain-containing protein n=1 Tax=Electrophorus voltai TaxID=2609070 RepID=A0AAD8ZSF7_9TELE|nr:hypothetical protein P4O66_003929 [Electrophorus voltai]